MFSALVVLGIFLCLSLPIYSVFYIAPKLVNQDHKDTLPFFAMAPGILLILLALFFRSGQPIKISEACGTVKFYKTYSIKHDSFERITIQFDDSQYNRHFTFEERLERKQKNEKVCFQYIDKFKNKDVGESKILAWLKDA